MKIRFLILASSLVLAACATSPNNEADQNVSESSEKVASNEAEVVCKREKIIGSNFSRKVCFTKESRDEASDKTRQRLERMRNQRSSTSGDF